MQHAPTVEVQGFVGEHGIPTPLNVPVQFAWVV
jgi:hypothetical protein